jgi:hypothetical protein
MQQNKSLIELHGTRFKLLLEPTSLGILSPILPKIRITKTFLIFGKNRPTTIGK